MADVTRPRGRILRWLALALGVWFLVNLAAVLWSWNTARAATWTHRALALDLRHDRSTPGRTVLIGSNRPHPERGDFIGHIWIIWPEPPPGEQFHSFGYYAASQPEAAAMLAYSLLAPWGVLQGAPEIAGGLWPDDKYTPEANIAVTVDQDAYARGLAAHGMWKRNRGYSARPALGASGEACVDYAFDVAAALGAKTPARNWAEFPASSFGDLVRENGLSLER